jgi:hypothetical protein
MGEVDTVVSEAQPVVTRDSQLKRLVNIFFAPSRAFAGVSTRPGWLLPFLILVVVSIGFQTFTGSVRMEDMKREIRNDPNIPPMQAAMRIANIDSQRQSSIFTPRALLGMGILAAGKLVELSFIALAAWLAALLSGASRGFSVTFAVVCLSWLVSIPELLLKTPLILAKQTMHVYSSLAALLPASMQDSILFGLADGIDLFTIWKLVLLSIGLVIAVGVKTSRARIVVLCLWGMGTVFSAFFGDLVQIS